MNFGDGTGGVSAGGDPRQMVNGANSLNYQIFKRNNYTNIWGSHLWPFAPTGKGTRVRLNGAGTGSKNQILRTEIYSGQAGTPAGVYTSVFSGGHTSIHYAYESVGNCNFISNNVPGTTVPFTVSAEVLGACTVTTTNMNFGTVGVLGSNTDTTNTISVNCNSGVPYTIGLDNGATGASPTARRMTNGGNFVTYGIYQDAARTTEWGETIGTNTISASGTGSVQNYTGYGRVPAQTTPVSGTYTDVVIVTVTY